MPFPLALASGVLARHRDPSVRLAPLIVLARPVDVPKILALASALTFGRAYEHNPGYHPKAPLDTIPKASPGTLAEVWRMPPADPSALWLAIRGDDRTPRPVPVILCDPDLWGQWHDFFTSSSRNLDTLPAHCAFYVKGAVESMTPDEARDFWAGLMASPKAPPRPQRVRASDFMEWADKIGELYYAEDESGGPTAPDPPDDGLAYLHRVMSAKPAPPPPPPHTD